MYVTGWSHREFQRPQSRLILVDTRNVNNKINSYQKTQYTNHNRNCNHRNIVSRIQMGTIFQKSRIFLGFRCDTVDLQIYWEKILNTCTKY